MVLNMLSSLSLGILEPFGHVRILSIRHGKFWKNLRLPRPWTNMGARRVLDASVACVLDCAGHERHVHGAARHLSA